MKKCSKCQTIKPLDSFCKDKIRKDGLSNYCKSCNSIQCAQYRESHQAQVKARSQAYYQNNKEKIAAYQRTRLDETREYRRTYYQQYNQTIDKSKRKEYNNAYYHQQKSNPAFKLARNARTRIWIALKGITKTDSTMDLIGCTRAQLMSHIESKFQSGMTWQNYGQWHVDHIKPCASFDLSQPEQQRECFHFSNLQPLWAADNLQKSDN